jgi:transposase
MLSADKQEEPMSRRRTDMRKLREIIRLHFETGMSANKIACSVNVARSVVQEYLRRARVHDLAWPLPAGMDDAQLENLLYPITVQGQQYAEPDWQSINEELKEKGITRELLWLDYKSNCGAGDKSPYSYQQFCRLYQAWTKGISVVMRQEHLAGEKLFVDFAGKTIPVINPETGEVTPAQIFVAVLGASNFTFVKACESQKIDSWLTALIGLYE